MSDNLPAVKEDQFHYFTDEKGNLHKEDILTGEIVSSAPQFEKGLVKGNRMSPEFIKGNGGTGWQYSPLYRDLICQRISEGKTITEISKLPGFPSTSIIAKWRATHDDLNEHLVAAKAMRAELHHDKIAAALEGMRDLGKDEVPAEKLYIDTNKWLAEKNDPATYGNKIQHSGDSKQPLTMVISTGVPSSEPEPDNVIDLDKGDYRET